jgi:hypothetical protein
VSSALNVAPKVLALAHVGSNVLADGMQKLESHAATQKLQNALRNGSMGNITAKLRNTNNHGVIMEHKHFPERDLTKPAEQQGIFRKFEVRRVDGSDHPGGRHHGCRYYVLDLDHDQHAPAAMRAYPAACASTHPELAADIEREFGSERAVSPAESVQSIEYDADFGLAIFAYNDARDRRGEQDSHILPQWIDLIKLLDVKIAAAHAEGQRSAMEELAKEKERAEDAEQRALNAECEVARLVAAARQAPDLSKLTRYTYDGAGEYTPTVSGEAYLVEDVQALLAQPLQQEGGKDVEAEQLRNEGYDVVCDRRDLFDFLRAAWREGQGRGGEMSEQERWSLATDHATKAIKGWATLRHIPQPSDNMQQASTARATIKESLQVAASATDAAIISKFESHINADHFPSTEPGAISYWITQEEVLKFAKSISAQVTPEGADLPLLPHTTYNGYSDGSEPLYTADQMRDYARTALAATTVAEPVAWVLFTEEGNSRIWFGSSDRAKLWAADNDVDPAELVPLYRAAPPQQVGTGGLLG